VQRLTASSPSKTAKLWIREHQELLRNHAVSGIAQKQLKAGAHLRMALPSKKADIWEPDAVLNVYLELIVDCTNDLTLSCDFN
jgi:hypothetical protein